MSPDENAYEKEKNESAPKGVSKGERILLNPEEWKKEPAEGKVIEEYHKEGFPEGAVGGDSDLDSFEQYWKVRGKSKVRSEYHKEGAPYMEAPPELDDHRLLLEETPDKTIEKNAPARKEPPQNTDTKGGAKGEEKGAQDTTRASDSQTREPHIERVLDITTIEVLALAIFRVIFGRGVRVPLKHEGIIDMDVVVKDKDVLLNTNEVLFEVPELSVWRFIIAYKGRPVLEYGRGVKRRIRIYYYHMFLFLLALWWAGWKKRRALAKAREPQAIANQTKRKVLVTDDR